MITECPKCGKIIHGKIGTYRYEESGLNNVYVQNIPVYQCSCGPAYASIFRMPRLNELIAETLLEKPALLNGKEIKFLRKSLYLSSKAFSDTLGIEKTTLSKWENDRQQHSEMNDRLIRLGYTVSKGVRRERAQGILKLLARMKLGRQDTALQISAEKIQDDYIVSWRPTPETCGLEVARAWAISEGLFQATTLPRWLIANLTSMTTNLRFCSSETLQTKTISYVCPRIVEGAV